MKYTTESEKSILLAGVLPQERTEQDRHLHWRRATLTDSEVRDLAKRIAAGPRGGELVSALPVIEEPQTSPRICWIEQGDKMVPHVLITPGESYIIDAEHERSRREEDPYLSPLGFFRGLKPGAPLHALQFLQAFGSLEYFDESVPRKQVLPENVAISGFMRSFWVNIDDFWRNRHSRLLAVSSLWEARNNASALRDAAELIDTLPFDRPAIGARNKGNGEYTSGYGPWHGNPEAWWSRTSETEIKKAVLEVIEREIQLHAGLDGHLEWTGSLEGPDMRFRATPVFTSLWAAMWHLFARTMNEGLGWRVCPHCSRLFYPKRKDSYFCRPEYQRQFSKNQWWEEHKDEQLERRRKDRLRDNNSTRSKPRLKRSR
jgi:hypothetical protein